MKRICNINANFGNLLGDVFFLGVPVTGKVQVVSKQDLNVIHFGYHFILEARGKVHTTKKILFTKNLLSVGQFIKNQVYNFDVNFKYNLVETYKGRNTNFITRLEFFIKLDGKLMSGKQETIFSKLTNTFKDLTNFTENVYLTFKSKNNAYSIDAPPQKAKIQYYGTGIVSFFIVIFFFTFSMNRSIPTNYIIGIGMIILLFYFTYWGVKKMIGGLTIAYENLDNNRFAFKISNDGKWKSVSKVSISYSIREEVIDRRGTSDTTLVKDIYQSKKLSKNNPAHEQSFEFDFPNDFPATTVIGDSRIYWVSTIKVKSVFGIVCKYKNEFIVKKI